MKIKEAIKTNDGKLIYVMECQQGEEGEKLQLYINSKNEICFGSNRYVFDNYATFKVNDDAHKIAKEIFLTYLQAYVKTRLLELKQLELILDELGLKEVIRRTIVDNSSMLLETKEEIIDASIEHTQRLITAGNKRAKAEATKIAKKAKAEVAEIAEEIAVEVVDDMVRPLAQKKQGKKRVSK